MTNKGRLIVISGPSGVGKGTICQRLLELCPNLRLSVSATTRNPRSVDQEGVTYFFKTEEAFRKMVENNELLEWAVYNGNYYGTPLVPVQDTLDQGINVLLEIDVQGALKVKKRFPEGIYIFIAPPDVETLRQRLQGRGTEKPEEIAHRVAAAEHELQQQDQYDYIIVNNVLEGAVASIQSIIQQRSVAL